MLVELGNLKYDLFGGFTVPIAPNGPTTGAPAFTPSDPALSVGYDGAVLTVTGIPDGADGDFTIHCEQPADDPGTAEAEVITADLHFTTSHSLATTFNVGAMTGIPR